MGYASIDLANCPNCFQLDVIVIFDRWRVQNFPRLSDAEKTRLTQERNRAGVFGHERREAYIAGELNDNADVIVLAAAAKMAEQLRLDKVKQEAVEMLQRDKLVA